MKKRTRAGMLILAMVLVFTMAGCGGSGSSGGSGDKEVVFNVALNGDIIKLDPAFTYDNNTSSVVTQITEGLLHFDENNQLQPWIAESWEAVDPLTYKYTIREGVTFSDGNPVTVDDVIYSMERIKDPATGSYLNWMYDSVESIEKTGDREITVKLSKPDATWQYVPATPGGHIIEKAYCEQHKDDFGSVSGGIIGTGPFVYLENSWKSGSEITLTRSSDYWYKDATTDIQKIVFKVIPDDTTMTTAIKSGQIDFTVSTPETMLDTLKSSDAVELLPTESFGVHYYAFNTSKAPFDDVNVRKAISYAIDLPTMQSSIVKDTGSIGTPMPMSQALMTIEPDRWKEYASKVTPYEYNLDKAKEYMAKSKVPNGFSCEITVNQTASNYSKALILQEALKKLNIEASINKVSADEFYTYQFGNNMKDGKRDYDILVATWGSDFPDPSGNLNPLYLTDNIKEGGSNCAAYSNPQVDEYLLAAHKSTDNSERTDLMFKALDIITADSPYIYTDYPIYYATLSKKFTGYVMTATFSWDMCFRDVTTVSE